MTFNYRDFPKQLNLGCGLDIKRGFLNIDMNPAHQPDLVADCTNLNQLPASYYDFVLAHDILEHISRIKTASTLQEWNRVMSMGGILEFKVPNVVALLGLLTEPENSSFARQEQLLRCLFGTQCYKGDFHYTGFTDITLKHYLASAGFAVEELTLSDQWMFQGLGRKIREANPNALNSIKNTQQFLTECYRKLLGRAPDKDGFDFYQAQLDAGADRDAIIEMIRVSDEYISKHSNHTQ